MMAIRACGKIGMLKQLLEQRAGRRLANAAMEMLKDTDA